MKDSASLCSELEQPGDRVHAVAELVRLRAQGVRDAAGAAELARQVLELRAVPQRHHRADATAPHVERLPVEHEDATGPQHDLVLALCRTGQHVVQPR